jgi:rhodanese-related sulfurtransferase
MSKKKSNRQKSTQYRKSGSQTQKSNPFWLIAGLIALVAISISAFVYLQQDQSNSAAAQAKLPLEISVDEAAAKRDQGAFILDVRQPEEWQEYHIPNSTLIPLGELPNRLNEVPQDREVVVVCRSGNRSQDGRDILLNAGYSSVTSMDGGVNQWRAGGYETVSGP